MINETIEENKEVSIDVLIKIANSGYTRNKEFGRAGLAKTYQEMKKVSDDDKLIRQAIIQSDYVQDEEFENLEDAMVLFS